MTQQEPALEDMAGPGQPAPIALRLGYLGLVPFAGLAAATLVSGPELRGAASFALLAYGATILSFLGGLYWGMAMASPAATGRLLTVFLIIGVIPQLLGWAALLVPAGAGHLLTAGGLLGLLAADRAAVRAGIAPLWFMRLRAPLSCAAGLAMLAGAFSYLV